MKTMKFWGVLLALVVGTLAVNAQTKTYSNHGVSMTYPSYLFIEEEEYEPGELTLALSDKDEMSGMYIVVSSDEVVLDMVAVMGVEEVYNLLQGELTDDLDGAKLGAITKTDTSITQAFTMSEDGITLNGEVALSLKGKKVVMTMFIAYGNDKYNALKQAIKTLKVS